MEPAAVAVVVVAVVAKAGAAQSGCLFLGRLTHQLPIGQTCKGDLVRTEAGELEIRADQRHSGSTRAQELQELQELMQGGGPLTVLPA